MCLSIHPNRDAYHRICNYVFDIPGLLLLQAYSAASRSTVTILSSASSTASRGSRLYLVPSTAPLRTRMTSAGSAAPKTALPATITLAPASAA